MKYNSEVSPQIIENKRFIITFYSVRFFCMENLMSFWDCYIALSNGLIYQPSLNSHEYSRPTSLFFFSWARRHREAWCGSRSEASIWLVDAKNSRRIPVWRSCDWFLRTLRCPRGRWQMRLGFQMGLPITCSLPLLKKVSWNWATSRKTRARGSMPICWRQKAFAKSHSSRTAL